jgi:carbon storage regulator
MLLLSRTPGEEVVVGDNLRLTVLGIHGNQVLLGFTAPHEVSIQRAELSLKAGESGTSAGRPATLEAEP